MLGAASIGLIQASHLHDTVQIVLGLTKATRPLQRNSTPDRAGDYFISPESCSYTMQESQHVISQTYPRQINVLMQGPRRPAFCFFTIMIMRATALQRWHYPLRTCTRCNCSARTGIQQRKTEVPAGLCGTSIESSALASLWSQTRSLMPLVAKANLRYNTDAPALWVVHLRQLVISIYAVQLSRKGKT